MQSLWGRDEGSVVEARLTFANYYYNIGLFFDILLIYNILKFNYTF